MDNCQSTLTIFSGNFLFFIFQSYNLLFESSWDFFFEVQWIAGGGLHTYSLGV